MSNSALEQLQAARRKLAHRRRRIIMNSDGDDFPPSTSVEDFLARRTIGLEGTHVDTISYCVINHGFGCGIHNSKACDFITKSGQALAAPDGWNHPDTLLDGKDGLQLMIDWCRQHKIELWASVRMNDTHDQWQVNARTPFKRDHPERWLAKPLDLGGGLEELAFLISEGALEHPPRWVPRGSCSVYYGADYTRADVRAKMFEIVADICARYDVDGIELDYLRGPIFFRANAEGKPDAGQENRDLMTALVRRVRDRMDEIGLRRGRPMLLAARAPDQPDHAAAMGLETARWLKEGLLDLLVAGESERTRPWREFAEFGHRHAVPVYACVAEISGCDEELRGRALAAWASGVDGVYTFNTFDPKSPLWKQLGDPKTLAALDRVTPVCNANLKRLLDHLTRSPDVRRFLVRPPRLPLELPHGREQTFAFEAGEDGARIAASPTPHATLRLRFELLESGDAVAVRLNEQPATLLRDRPLPGWITCAELAPLLRWGDNTLQIVVHQANQKAGLPPRLADVQVHVTTRPQTFAEAGAAADGGRGASQRDGLLGTAFVLTEDAILPPNRPVTALQQWLLDELTFARPRVPGVRKFLKQHLPSLPADPAEQPLPGWDSLAVLFDTDQMGADFERAMLRAFFQRVAGRERKGNLALYAGPLAGSHTLAALMVRSPQREDLAAVAGGFGVDCKITGLLPLPIRFLRGEADGHLIPRAFALVLRGTLQAGTFIAERGGWNGNQLTAQDLRATTWKLG